MVGKRGFCRVCRAENLVKAKDQAHSLVAALMREQGEVISASTIAARPGLVRFGDETSGLSA